MLSRFMTLLALLPFGLLAACGGSSSSDITGGNGNNQTNTATSTCNDQSWIGGTAEMCGGVLTYRDYVYDDHGADTSPVYNSPIGTLSPVAGNATYPAGSENTADLVKLEIGIDNNQLAITAELNTLFEADSTRLAVAFDTDNDQGTGGGEWPGLGISSDGWEVIHFLDTGDPDTNIMSDTFPLPTGDTWRVQAVVAQANGTVMNVAFRGTGEEANGPGAEPGAGTWWEDKQAAALAAGDIGEFGHVVKAGDMTRGATIPDRIGPGFHQRVYTSQYTLPPGEGVDMEGVPGRHGDTGNTCEQYFHFLGKYQPYGMYIPDQAGPHGIQFVLHGCGANHASLINNPGMQGRFGEDLNRILLVPLGRSPVGFYSDISERDVLDVLDDVLANYAIDEDKVFSGGYSMGGYGGMRFASLYPHLFAGLVNWVGFTGDVFNTPIPGNPIPPETEDGGSTSGAVGNVIDFIGNMRHIPSANLYSGEDELVHVNTALALMDRYRNAEVPYEFFLHPIAEHLTYAVLDEWVKEAEYSAGRTRVQNPQHITYRTDESLAFPEYDISHDRAYWLSDIAGRDEGHIDIDITSFGCGGEVPVYTTGQDAGTGPAVLPWVSEFREQSGTEPLAPSNGFQATLANVSGLTIDTGNACLTADPVGYELTTDGPVTIRLSDGRSLVIEDAGEHMGSF